MRIREAVAEDPRAEDIAGQGIADEAKDFTYSQYADYYDRHVTP